VKELFERAELVSIAPGLIEPNQWPYFIAAYWPGNKTWSIHDEMYREPDSRGLLEAIKVLDGRGWRGITVCRLPDLPGEVKDAEA